MAATTIKDGFQGGSDNQAKVDDTGHLLVTGNVGGNASVSTTGTTAPTSATEIAGVDSAGNLVPVLVDSTGAVVISGETGAEGFSTLAPGYPKQIAVGTTSVQLFPSNSLRKYAHIMNNSSEAIYIQYSSSAMLNQGIKIGPGTFFTLDTINLWLGVVNGIGLMAGQLIDVLEGEE